jgi:hypothetical protein
MSIYLNFPRRHCFFLNFSSSIFGYGRLGRTGAPRSGRTMYPMDSAGVRRLRYHADVKVILFGASGMVGQGVLRECLRDPDVEAVLLIGRSASRHRHPKIEEIVHADIADLSSFESRLTGFSACFFCLGVSSVGMSASDYKRVTYDLTIRVAGALARLNPEMTFVYVSGTGTDSTERGRTMWARVKGATENALLRMPFRAAYMFRPGLIQPMHGEKPKAAAIRIALTLMGPLIPILIRIAPKYVTTTERIGKAMLIVARSGTSKKILESVDINELVAKQL